MNHAVRGGDEEAVEILAQLFDFVATRDAVDFEERGCRFGIVGFKLQPDIRLAQVGDFVDPKPVWPKLKNAAVRLFFDQG